MSEASPPNDGDQRSLPNEADLGGRLGENIMHFARVLRAAGLPIGPGRVIDALNAIQVIGLRNRQDFYWTLHSIFVNRQDQRELFDQAFHIFWRNPDILERMMQLMLPDVGASQELPPQDEISRRLAEALSPGQGDSDENAEQKEELELDATMTWSATENLATKDFENMSSAEVSAAIAAIKRMRLPIMNVQTRRYRPNPQGNRTDLRRSLRAAL
ncbi:MAG: VWA domain-containing protein, partial [Proteobacteria bacterium]|nr:VWA domain-containing protein [Pseudomonadota bacterium]